MDAAGGVFFLFTLSRLVEDRFDLLVSGCASGTGRLLAQTLIVGNAPCRSSMTTVLSLPLSSSPESLGDPSKLGQPSTSTISFLTIPGPGHPSLTAPRNPAIPASGEEEVRIQVLDPIANTDHPSLKISHYAPGKRPLSTSPLVEEPIETKVGPPPPSPPASVGDEQEMEDERIPESPRSHTFSNGRPVTFEDPPRQPSSERKVSPRLPPSIGRRSSADTDVSQKYVISSPSPRLGRTQSDGAFLAPSTTSPEDSLLHPSHHIPSRRNTTGSAALLPSSSRHPPVSLGQQYSHDTIDVGGEFGELASDIQLQAEQIRKERLSKRKAAQEAEKEMTKVGQEINRLARTTSLARALSNHGEDKPVVGNLIGEGHVNYVLMFNMLTGIRVAVSRCQAKMRRQLTDEDYSAAHKYSFDLYVSPNRVKASSLTFL